MTRRSTLSPRPSSTCRSAPATATRTASLVVAPDRCATARRSSYLECTTRMRRFGPVGCMSEHLAIRGGWSPPPAPMEERRSRHEPATPTTALAFLTSASSSSATTAGGASGKADAMAPDPGSTRLARTLSPPIPSARTWCRTTRRALRSSCRPPTRITDHSGASLRSGDRTDASAVSISARSSPGARQVTSRTWSRRSNPASSTQIGPPQPNGTDTSTWRNRGTAPMRWPTRSRTRARDRRPSSWSRTPNCWGTSPVSMAKKARSVALARWMLGRVPTAGAAGPPVTLMPPDNTLARCPGRVQGPRSVAVEKPVPRTSARCSARVTTLGPSPSATEACGPFAPASRGGVLAVRRRGSVCRMSWQHAPESHPAPAKTATPCQTAPDPRRPSEQCRRTTSGRWSHERHVEAGGREGSPRGAEPQSAPRTGGRLLPRSPRPCVST